MQKAVKAAAREAKLSTNISPHPHVHALVPGGGPSLDGEHWITTRHPTQRRRTKPYLTDNCWLGEKFKEHFCAGLKRLHRQGLIAFDPPVLPIGEPSRPFVKATAVCREIRLLRHCARRYTKAHPLLREIASA